MREIKMLKQLIKIANSLDGHNMLNESEILDSVIYKLAYTSEMQGTASEMAAIDPEKAQFEHLGLFKKISQQPINLVSRLSRPEIAIESFLGGANIQDMVSRAVMELNILAQRLGGYEKEMGMPRLQQMGSVKVLEMMNHPEIEAIYYSDPESLEHERRHQRGETKTPEQVKQDIASQLQSVFPQEVPPEERQRIISEWMDNYISNLGRYYAQGEIPGELAADLPTITDKAKKDLSQMF